MNTGDLHFGIDTETGGFEPGKHALLAIGCWWSTGSGVDMGLRVLVDRQPGTIVEPAAAAKNGWVSDVDWRDRGALPLRAAVSRLLAYVQKLRSVTVAQKLVAVAHNAYHDRQFIEHALLHCGAGDCLIEQWQEHVRRNWRCSLQALCAAMDAGLVPSGSAKLERLVLLSHQLPRKKSTHDAQQDAEFAFNGYLWLKARMREGLRHGTENTLTGGSG